MANLKAPDPKQDCPFKFFSFLQCSTKRQHSKSVSNDSTVDSGICADKNERSANILIDDVVVIDDDDEDNGDNAEFELLCEVEFDTAQPLPLPIEDKLMLKVESETIHESRAQRSNELGNDTSTGATFDQPNLDECEEELLPFCKLEPNYDLNEVNNTAANHATSSAGGNNFIFFICPQCGLSFETSTTWHEHITKQHNLLDHRTYNFKQRPNNEFECQKCKAVITRCTLKTLQQHHFTHLPHKIYKCKLCMYEASRLYLMISHVMLHKDREEVGAAVFAQKGGTSTSQIQVALEHESRQFIAYICPACGITFDSEDAWQAHINFRHNFLEKTAENRYNDHFKCSECGVEIFSQHIPDLQLHLFTHLPHKSFLKCKLCNWTISRKNFMTSHIFNLHKNHLSATANISIAPMTGKSLTDSHSFDYSLDNDNNIVKSPLPLTATVATATVATPSPAPAPLSNLNQSLLPDTNDTSNVALQKRHSLPVRVSSPKQPLTGNRAFVEPVALTTAEHHNASIKPKSPTERLHKYKCKSCHESFRLKADMKRHKCMKEEMQCNICFKEYSYEKSYYNHIRRCRLTPQQKKSVTTRGNRTTYSMSDDDSD